jgi:glycosyltransferase involved in cell wall biosynthesis
VIIPIYNGEAWIEECFKAIQLQTAVGHIKLEISVYDDASTDQTWAMLQDWRYKLNSAGIRFTLSKNESLRPRGGKVQCWILYIILHPIILLQTERVFIWMILFIPNM